MKKILSFLLLGLICSIGNLWADVTVPSSTLSLPTIQGTGWAGKATPAYINPSSTDWYCFLPYEIYQSGGDIAWAAASKTGSTDASWDALSPFPASSQWTGVKAAKLRDGQGGPYYYRVTNCIEVSVLGKSGSEGKRTVYLKVYELTAGVASASPVGQSSFDANSNTVITVDDLDKDKEYVVEVSQLCSGSGGNSDGNSSFCAVAFKAAPAEIHSVTYVLNGGTGSAPTQADVAKNETFTVASAEGITPPANKEFDCWNDGNNNYAPGETYTMGSSDVTLTAIWRNATIKSAINYANLNGADNSANPTEYSEGVGITSFEPITRDGYVFTGWTPSSISASATGAQTITANWLEAVDKIIYSWESDGTATEIGGTATGIGDATYVNYANSGYYTLRGADKSDFSGKYVQIDLSNNMITGDNILLKAYYTKDSDKDVAVKIADGNNNNATILTSDNLPNIYNGANPPSVKKYAVPSGISTNRINITRSATATTAFIIKIQILRTVGLLSKTYNGVKVEGVTTDVTKEGNTITLNSSYVSAPNVALVEHQEYNDDTNADIEIEVENFEVAGNFFVGTATVANTLYTVKVPKLASYTVTYMDGEVVLGTETVVANNPPTEFGNYETPQLATFGGWYSDAGLNTPVANMATEAITADVTYYVKYSSKLYATSINIEKYALRSGKDSVKTVELVAQMGAQHYASNFAYKKGDNEIDYLNDSKDNRNYAYLGLKIKSAGTMLNFRVAKNNTVKVKFGNVGKTPLVSINGSDYANMAITDHVYSYTAVADALISIKTADASAVVLQQIAIGEELAASEYEVEITLGENGYSTFATDYKYTVEGAEVYKAAYNGSNAVTLTEVVDAVVPANAGIILKGTTGEIVTLTASGSAATELAGNGLVGVVAPLAASAGMYVLSTNAGVTAFNPCQVGLEIPAHKAYISIPSNAPAIRIIFAENGATGINELEGAENAVKFIENGKLYIQKDGVVYDATGAKVK